IALKLGDQPGDEKARRWLIQWIRNPGVYHPRTFMPVTHLHADEAADLAAWLLEQRPNWKGPEVPAPDVAKLKQLARVYLIKSLPRYVVDEQLKSDASTDKLVSGQIDKDDQPLTEKLDLAGKLKVYIGKKSINQLGCYGCHDVSGFETAKPIGTVLNDWGRKDPERIAFEDISAYVHEHYYPVPTATQEDGAGHPEEDGKKPFERFFLEALNGHQRDGFLYQKLQEPRSYDYARTRSWDERLRMPQFKFARMQADPVEGEKLETAQLRTETAAREQVMTFVLGLLAEPIPFSYLYDPGPDKAAIVKGKQVLDKFNCAGCHQLRTGIYEFNSGPVGEDGSYPVLDRAEAAYANYERITAKAEIKFPESNVWTGKPNEPNRLRVYGIPEGTPPKDAESYDLRLTQALQFNRVQDVHKPASERAKLALNLPAAENLTVVPGSQLRYRADPHGGAFADLLVPYLMKSGLADYNSPPNARAGLPPPLLREGEKVQPAWLFQFLRDPQPIRPLAVLRMPRFNMSDDEAMALVNYFAAQDRLSNPGIGLDYPYFDTPQRDPDFWVHKTREYRGRLGKEKLEMRADEFKPIWEKVLADRTADLKQQIADLEKAIPNTKDADTQSKQKALLADSKRELEKLEKGNYVADERAAWLREGAYATDAYRLLVNRATCLTCHNVAGQNAAPKGPDLSQAYRRLRPDWTGRWIASPQQLLVFPSGFHPMTAFFLANDPKYQNIFPGAPRQQALGIRDILMDFPRVADMPANRTYRPPAGDSQ
ncbi:MAG: hypothetical protein AB7K24_18640, partial [Gemmataceae bacterium]